MKMAKQLSEEFQEVSEVLCESPFWLSHNLFHMLIGSWSDQYYHGPCSISALASCFSHVYRLLVGPVPRG